MKQNIDIIILSDAKNDYFKQLTNSCISTLKKSSTTINFIIFVVESNHDVFYDDCITLHLNKEFNYNAYANAAIELGKSKWVCVCNNDLIFTTNCFENMLSYNFDSMSPISHTTQTQDQFKYKTEPIKGYKIAQHISGWCILFKREIWQLINGLDEHVSFWASDDAYAEQLQEKNVEHYLIPTAVVNHINGGSNTLKTLDMNTKEQLTYEQAKKFNRKYNKNLFNLGEN